MISPTSSGWSGTLRSLCSLPTGMRSHQRSPTLYVASSLSPPSSPALIPVRANSSTSSRRRRSGSAARVAMNFAAVGSSRNFGSGSSALGTSPAKIGTRRGASSQSQSMIRSKNVLIMPRLWRMVVVEIDPLRVPDGPQRPV